MPKLAKPNRIVELSRYHRPWLENALQCSWVSRESKNGPCRLGRNNILHASNCWDECHVNNNINTIFLKFIFCFVFKSRFNRAFVNELFKENFDNNFMRNIKSCHKISYFFIFL